MLLKSVGWLCNRFHASLWSGAVLLIHGRGLPFEIQARPQGQGRREEEHGIRYSRSQLN